MTKFQSALVAGIALFFGSVAGYQQALNSVFKDCQEFGGAKLMSGVVIECKVEVLKP